MATELEQVCQALKIFANCPDWRRFVHDMDCADPGGHEDSTPSDERKFPDCTCDGPHNVKIIEGALKIAENVSSDQPINLLETLQEYGRHSEGCSQAIDKQYRCRCGWDEIEEQLEALDKGTDNEKT